MIEINTSETIKNWKASSSWMETDIDNNESNNRADEFEKQLIMEQRAAKSSKTDHVYLNAYESSALPHNYENFHHQNMNENEVQEHSKLNAHLIASNPYEDDVQTVHSEGIRSELAEMPPPLHHNSCLTLIEGIFAMKSTKSIVLCNWH